MVSSMERLPCSLSLRTRHPAVILMCVHVWLAWMCVLVCIHIWCMCVHVLGPSALCRHAPVPCCRNPYFTNFNRLVYLYTQHSRTVPVLSIPECNLLFMLYMLRPRVDYPPLVLNYSSKTLEHLLPLHYMISDYLYLLCCAPLLLVG